MKQYYYSENNQQLGPFTVDELKSKRLKKSTLVWTDGMNDWAIAETIQELQEIIISEPPPLPKENINSKPETVIIRQSKPLLSNHRYEATYNKETEATFLGIILFIIPLVLKLTGAFEFDSEESFNLTKRFILIVSAIVRIFVTIWVVKIASRQNRNSTIWGFFALLFPSIALIIIGQLKKLKLKIDLDSTLPSEVQLSILNQKANSLISDLRYNEALSVFMKIKELKYDYPSIEENIKECELKITERNHFPNKTSENSMTNTINEKIFKAYNSDKGIIDIEYNNSIGVPDLGDKVFQNGQPADSRKYKLGFMWYVHVDKGIITKITLI